jgi:hypothetical protein
MTPIVYVAVVPFIKRSANTKELALLRPPRTPLAVPLAASEVKSIYLGIATTARIPIITMITTNSINVKPFWFPSIFASYIKE